MDKKAKTDHPVIDPIAERWSPRSFADRDVPADALASLFEAARWAASSFNDQPWSFLVATRDDPAEHDRMLSCLNEWNRRWAAGAPVLVLTVARHDFRHNGKRHRLAQHDVGLAVGNLSIPAAALGLSVHQMAGILPDEAKKVYRVPDGHEVLTGIAIGYAGDPDALPEDYRDAERAPRDRSPLSEIVFRSSFGESAGIGED